MQQILHFLKHYIILYKIRLKSTFSSFFMEGNLEIPLFICFILLFILSFDTKIVNQSPCICSQSKCLFKKKILRVPCPQEPPQGGF